MSGRRQNAARRWLTLASAFAAASYQLPASAASSTEETAASRTMEQSGDRPAEIESQAVPAKSGQAPPRLSAAGVSAKRALPDYEGRGGAPTTAGDVLLWVPRVVLSPAYLVSEFALRRPLGAAVPAAERAQIPQALYDFFFFGPDHKAGVAPIAFVDFGFRPSVGLFAFWDDAFFKGHDLAIHGSTWGSAWLAGKVTERFRFRDSDSVTLAALAVRRPDYAFFGLGSDSLQSNISRYGQDRLEASALGHFSVTRSLQVETGLALRSVDFRPGDLGSDPSLPERAATGAFVVPPGFQGGYTAFINRVAASLDSRAPRPARGSGFRLELENEHGGDLRRSPGATWLRYGGTAGAFLDVSGTDRVLSLSCSTLFVDPLGSQPVPFSELVTVGGNGTMRGFYPGRLIDRSAAAATLKYRWPIWVWLDGSLQTAVGNVFSKHLDDFAVGRFRFSGALGVESVGATDSSFELLVGTGTETIDHGAQLDSVRIVLGTNHGF